MTPSPEDQMEAEPKAIELFSWWLAGGERQALYALLDLHEQDHPDTVVINLAENSAERARETLTLRMAGDDPPDTFQANIGADLLQWVESDSEQAPLLQLDDLAEEEGWFDVLPVELRDAASHDGHLYGVPLNVHRINSLFYDKRLFERYGLTPPRTLEELNQLVVAIATNDDIQSSNPLGVAPLSLGNRWDWTLSLFAFEAVLPAVAGPDYYERFWTGSGDATDPEIAATLDEVLFLYCGSDPSSRCDGYFNSDADDVDWTDALQKLVDGEAAMAVMGDWAKGYFEDRDWVADEDFGVVPFPGSDGTYVFTADTFPLTRGSQRRATSELLATIGSVSGQVAFNGLKGSIPARTDIDPSDHPDTFDAMDQRTVHQFRDGRRVLALSGLLPGDLRAELAARLKQSMNQGTTQVVLDYLAEQYDQL